MLDTSAAEAFDDQLVPRVFGPWAELVVARAAPKPADCVLDVACATGAAAKAAARTARRVVGVDIDPAMVAVAKRRSTDFGERIEWRCADALRLPFQDAAFDLCLCLQGLQFFPDAVCALGELRRVLKPGARLCASLWADIEHVPGYCAVVDALEQEGIDASSIRQAFGLGNADRVRALLARAGYTAITVNTEECVASFPSVEAFVAMLGAGSSASRGPLRALDPARRQRFTNAVEVRLSRFATSGSLGLPYRAHVAEARNPQVSNAVANGATR